MQINSDPVHAPVTDHARDSFALDATRSRVRFAVRHFTSEVRGTFTRLEGTVVYRSERPELMTIDVTIHVASVDTGDATCDEHLRRAEFFDADSYPRARFVSRRVRGCGSRLEVLGDLTVRSTTRPIELVVERVTPELLGGEGISRIAASAVARVRRSDFGLCGNSVLETGGILVGDEVSITADVELVRLVYARLEPGGLHPHDSIGPDRI